MNDGDLGDFEPDGQAAAENDPAAAYVAMVEEALDGVQTEPMEKGLAIDLVTRQVVYVRKRVAETLADYYEAEGFDLATYKMHPFLPVRTDDAVFECVYAADGPEAAHKTGKTYDFPRGRLMHYPIEMAWSGAEVGDV